MRDVIHGPVSPFQSDPIPIRVHSRPAEVCPLGTLLAAERQCTMTTTHARRTSRCTGVPSRHSDSRSHRHGDAPIPTLSEMPLTDARLAARVLGPLLTPDSVDAFGVACLSRKWRLLAWHQLDRRTAVRPMPTAHELLFVPVLALGTDAVIVVHAHPNDDPGPTPGDAVLTARMALAADRFGVPLIDHLIVDRRGDRYFSFYEFSLADATDSYLKRPPGHHVA